MIQANPPPPAAQAMLQRVLNLQQRLNNQIADSTELRNRTRDLEARVEVLRRENEQAMQKVREYTEKVESLGKEAENLRILAGASSGVATGLLLGVTGGATGPTLALCGVGGGLSGAGAAYVYNKCLE